MTVPRKLTVSATVAAQFWIVLRAKPQNEYRHGYDHCISSLEMYFRHVLPVNRTVSEFVPNSCRRVSRVTTAGDQTDFPKSKMASANVSPPLCVRVHYELHFDDYDVRDNSWSWFNDELTIFRLCCSSEFYIVHVFTWRWNARLY